MPSIVGSLSGSYLAYLYLERQQSELDIYMQALSFIGGIALLVLTIHLARYNQHVRDTFKIYTTNSVIWAISALAYATLALILRI